jgi:chaperonin cofactor prefoldin
MVQRARDARAGTKRVPARKDQPLSSVGLAEPVQRLQMVEAERDRLKARLEEAEARIAELEKVEKRQSLVVNRIDWLIDTLGSALEKRV